MHLCVVFVFLQLSKSLVEGRQRRKLYETVRQAEGATQEGTGEPGMMMRLAEGMSKAQEDRLDIPAYSTAPPQVTPLGYISWNISSAPTSLVILLF